MKTYEKNIWAYSLTNLKAINNFTFFSLLFPSFLQAHILEYARLYLPVYIFLFFF